MNIAVNTRLLLKDRLEGIGQFTYESLRRITEWHPEHHFHFIFDREYDKSFVFSENVTPVVAHPQARHPYLWYLFFEYGIPLRLRRIKPDLFLSTDGWIPTNIKVPIVNVIHDLNFMHNPELVPPTERRYYSRFFPRFASRASRIATVSEFSRKDISTQFGIPESRIDVVYSGSNPLYRPLPEEERARIRQQFANGCEFFVFVGLIHKRKNLDNIFKAFDNFKSEHACDVKLLVVGKKKWWKGEIEDTYNTMTYKEDVIMLGYQPTDVVVKLVASSLGVVYPSLFEGFGLPIVDAFNAMVPVITSNVTSMPEIAGDAALIVDPHDPLQISGAMQKLFTDRGLRDLLISNAMRRKDLFTWDRTAQLLWKTIEMTIQ